MSRIDYVKLSKKISNGKAEVIFRIYITNKFKPQFRSGIYVDINSFELTEPAKVRGDEGHKEERYRNYNIKIPRSTGFNGEIIRSLNETKTKLNTYERRLTNACNELSRMEDNITSERIKKAVRELEKNNVSPEQITYDLIVSLIDVNEEEINHKDKSIYELAEEYLKENPFSKDHEKGFRVLLRDLSRYEAFVRVMDKDKKDFKWNVDTITRKDIEDFIEYLRNERSYCDNYPKLFEKLLEEYPLEITPKHKSPKLTERGDNTIIKLKKKFKSFFAWLNEKEYTNNHPFDGVKIGTEKYGAPIYIHIEERNKIANFDLSAFPELEVQRDIFIFQCKTGCRVGDLMRLRESNITGNVLEYVPNKTKGDSKPVKPRVPLTNETMSLISKYKGVDKKGRLFPFISSQKYNEAIKKIFLKCGITRNVIVRNPKTGESESRPINEVASSHMARRTFVGAAYKQVKDPNIVGKMSGHVEGSRAFVRYRNIDDEILSEVINAIE